jgi:Arc/MetJ-type ribon-helix-helix transcriptional regulator
MSDNRNTRKATSVTISASQAEAIRGRVSYANVSAFVRKAIDEKLAKEGAK